MPDPAPQAWLHTLDPFLIQFASGFGIRWYGLSYLAGFVVAYLILRRLSKRGLSQLSPAQVSDFVFATAVGTVVGGRLGYCLFYSPELLTRFTGQFPFWGLLAVNEGGMASHGGIIGIAVAGLWYARRHGLSALHLMDLAAFTGPIGIFFGRTANFINGELVGRPAPPGFAWAVKFPQDLLLWPGREPERLNNLVDAVAVLGISRERWGDAVARITVDRRAWQLVDQTIAQIIDGVQHGNILLSDALRPHLTARYPSQLYAALLEGALVFLLLLILWRKPRKPGVIAAAFFIVYSIVRIFDEHYRMPDAHIGFMAFGLTRGQWLSVVMLLGGVFFLWLWSRAPRPGIGGWGRGSAKSSPKNSST